MRITYLKLENVAGIMVGSNKSIIEIDFSKSKNKIIAIQGVNGSGKSVLISSIHPFSGVTSIDDRSSLSYIIAEKNGYKEIHYVNNGDIFVIKHYYKPKGKSSHTVKSYFSVNGVELNENGNVRSFLSLVEVHLGFTQEMMRLVRLGSNVHSFVTLPVAQRKEYISNLIDEIDAYMYIYKGINDDIKVVKALMTTNNNNLYNCHISDLLLEEEKLRKMMKSIKEHEKEKENIIRKLGKIQQLTSMHDITDLKRKCIETESTLAEFERIEDTIERLSLQSTSVEQLIRRRGDLTNDKVSVQSKINSYRISIDNTLRNIERTEGNIKRITSSNDVQSLLSAIESLKVTIESTSDLVKGFVLSNSSSSDDIYQMLSKLSSFNQIGQMIYTFGSKPTEVYLRLRDSNKSVDKFLKDQAKKNVSRISDSDMKSLFERVFGDDMIISPNCGTEYEECPYYRLHSVITEIHDKLEDETFDDETLRYIQVISNNIDNIMNEIDRMEKIRIPDAYRDDLREKRVLDRLRSKLPLFDLSSIQEYLSLLTEAEIYRDNIEKLKQFEHQLSVYKKSGVDDQMEEIRQLRESIEFYKSNVETLSSDIDKIDEKLDEVDEQITIVSKYVDSKKYKGIMQSTLSSTMKILEPLEKAVTEKSELEFQLRQKTNLINSEREEHKSLETRIDEYKRLVKEGEELNEQHRDLTIILNSVSTKKGIPVKYIKKYLGKIQRLANDLLKLMYDDEFKLAKFNVNQDTFEIPYIKNGIKMADIKYSSQSELAVSTMALSFALANSAASIYNILLIDEMDGGLDDINRTAFLKMLYKQMSTLNAEQVFVISHNMSHMVNIPMDVIKMSDSVVTSRLQNIIYDIKMAS